MKWFSSDWHLGHRVTLTKGERPFDSLEEMDATIIKNMTTIPKKGDILYFLGDIGWKNDSVYEIIKKLSKNGIQFIWIAGNHDDKLIKQMYSFVKQCSKKNAIYSIFETKLTDENFEHYHTTLCHYPMMSWNRSHYGAFQLFGHHHKTALSIEGATDFEKQGKRLNVCCEFFDFKPVSEIEVINIMKSRPDNWDIIKK